MAEIRLSNISKTFGDKLVLKGIELTIKEGELISLLGPSGCGKTTLLKIIAGLEEPSGGRIYFGGRDVTEIEASKRNAIIMFQDYRLFPHMTVFENIEFGLAVRKIGKAERAGIVKEMLELVQLSGMENSYPSQISGGQKQRTALARALVIKPKVLLLDEPFSNLDTALRENMREFILKLHKELMFTAVLVTHDKEEAFMMTDKAAVMINGKLQQYGKPKDIFRKPATKELAEFLGEANFIDGTVKDGVFENRSGRFKITLDNLSLPEKANAQLMLRYDQLNLTKDATGIGCEIIDKRFGSRSYFYKVKINEELVLNLITADNDFQLSENAFIYIKDSELVVY